MSVKAIKFNR